MQEKLAEMSADEATYAKLREIFVNAPGPENRDKGYYWERDTLLDLAADGPWLIDRGLTFTVKKFKGTLPLAAVLPDGKHYEVYVQVPHIGLLMINEVQVEEDCCTDNLQRLLDKGWRILCVCPPNAQRRPDYILGRTKDRE
jgi:hypothetical protein